jgi:hypothetical protein
MQFEPDDLDWAMGELLHLFALAARLGVYPHHLRPDIFHPAWTVLNAQAFPIRQEAHRGLMTIYRPPPRSFAHGSRAKRYAYAVTE